MQEELTVERTNGQASRAEMEDWRARVEQMRGVVKHYTLYKCQITPIMQEFLSIKHKSDKPSYSLAAKTLKHKNTICTFYFLS